MSSTSFSSVSSPPQSPGRVPVRKGDRHSRPIADAPSSPGLKTTQRSSGLVSVTVRKEYRGQKSGISLVERQGGVYVTAIAEGGLFDGTDVEKGDRILSMNGQRLQHGDTVKNVLKQIATGNELTITMVVKKGGNDSFGGGGTGKKKPVRRMFKKDVLRNGDGSISTIHDPRCLPRDEEEYDQIPVKATRNFPGQATGVTFVDYDKKVFITHIEVDSIFRSTNLSVGDRVVAVNGMSFMSYADANLATKQSKKEKEVTIVVEKGHPNIPKEARAELESTEFEFRIDDLDGVTSSDDDDNDGNNDESNKLNSSSSSLHMSLSGTSLHSLDRKSGRSLGPRSLSGRSLSSQSSTGRGKKAKPLRGKRNNVPTKQKKMELDFDDGDDSSTTSSSSESISSVEQFGDHRDQGILSPRGLRPSKSGSIKKVQRAPQLQGGSGSSLFDGSVKSVKSNSSSKNSLSGSPKYFQPSRAKKDKEGGDRDRSLRSTGKKQRSKSSVNSHDSSSESSLEDADAEDVHVLSKGKGMSKKENGHSPNASLSSMKPEDYGGDFIRITVAKKSESKPGIQVKKIEGKLILVGLPSHEKRIPLGVQVLAVNGQMNLSTAKKAKEVMKKTAGHVTLMIDFSSSIVSQLSCPCCGDPIVANGNHVSGKNGSKRGRGNDNRSFSSEESEYSSDGSHEGRHSGHSATGRSAAGQKISRHSQSNDSINSVREYDSDSSVSLNDLMQQRPSNATAAGTGTGAAHAKKGGNRFNAGDKFMVRVTKSRDQELGISLVDHHDSVYVGRIKKESLFSSTPIETGDVVVSINGVRNIKHATEAMRIIDGPRNAICMYVQRSDKTSSEVKEALRKGR